MLILQYQKTCNAKKDFFKEYLEYAIQSFRTMKIAIVSYHTEAIKTLQELLDTKNVHCNFLNMKKLMLFDR